MTRGFSLLELIVTLVIAGILAALVVPMFNQSSIDASWFQEQVKSALRYAQRQAVAQRRPVIVLITAGQVQLCYQVVAGACTQPLTEVTTGAPYSLVAPSGVVLSAANISFNGLGQPAGTPSFTVAGQPVLIEPETGYVR